MNGKDRGLASERVSALETVETRFVIGRMSLRRWGRWGGLVDDLIIFAEEELLIVGSEGIDHGGRLASKPVLCYYNFWRGCLS